jgi:hypothetical protein
MSDGKTDHLNLQASNAAAEEEEKPEDKGPSTPRLLHNSDEND